MNIYNKDWNKLLDKATDDYTAIARPMTKRYFKRYMEHLNDLLDLRSGERFLEAPAANGVMSEYFRKVYGVIPTCVDINPRMCALSKKKNLFTTQASVTELDKVFGSNSFDKILMGGVAMHLSQEDLLETIKGCLSIYTGTGRIVIHDIPILQGEVSIEHMIRMTDKCRPSAFNMLNWTYHDLDLIDRMLKPYDHFIYRQTEYVTKILKNWQFMVDIVIGGKSK